MWLQNQYVTLQQLKCSISYYEIKTDAFVKVAVCRVPESALVRLNSEARANTFVHVCLHICCIFVHQLFRDLIFHSPFQVVLQILSYLHSSFSIHLALPYQHVL